MTIDIITIAQKWSAAFFYVILRWCCLGGCRDLIVLVAKVVENSIHLFWVSRLFVNFLTRYCLCGSFSPFLGRCLTLRYLLVHICMHSAIFTITRKSIKSCTDCSNYFVLKRQTHFFSSSFSSPQVCLSF